MSRTAPSLDVPQHDKLSCTLDTGSPCCAADSTSRTRCSDCAIATKLQRRAFSRHNQNKCDSIDISSHIWELSPALVEDIEHDTIYHNFHMLRHDLRYYPEFCISDMSGTTCTASLSGCLAAVPSQCTCRDNDRHTLSTPLSWRRRRGPRSCDN